MSVSVPSGRWNLIARPCGFAFMSPSGMSGRPVASEKRTVTGTVTPLWRWAARLTLAASGAAANVPSATRPLAWLTRWPGCLPKSAWKASTSCSSMAGSSAAAGRGVIVAVERAKRAVTAQTGVRRSMPASLMARAVAG